MRRKTFDSAGYDLALKRILLYIPTDRQLSLSWIHRQ